MQKRAAAKEKERKAKEQAAKAEGSKRSWNTAMRNRKSKLTLSLLGGKKVCFRFQTGGCDKGSECPFVHQCANCGGTKGYASCNCKL